MTPLPIQEARFLDALMGIRYLAAVHVALYHLGYFRVPVSVPFFFVLSGFILAICYSGPDAMAVDARTFWVARFSRLYPCHLLALAAVVVYRVATDGDLLRSLGSLAAHALMLQSWLPWMVMKWNTPSWTISCEAFFYLVFPLLISVTRFLRGRTGLLVAFGLSYAAGLATTWALWHRRESFILEAVDLPFLYAKYSPLAHLPEFATGVLLGVHYQRERPARNPGLGALVSGGCLVVAVVVTVVMSGIPFGYVHNSLLAPVFALMIWGLALGGGIAGPLAHPRLVALGKASYAFFVFQAPIGMLLYLSIGEQAWQDHPHLVTLGFLAVLTKCAEVIYQRFEIPSNRFLRATLTARPTPAGPCPPPASARHSLAMMAVAGLLVLGVSRLPEHEPPRSKTLDRILVEAEASWVEWDSRAGRKSLHAYAAALPGAWFTALPPDGQRPGAPWVLATPAWEGARVRGARFVDLEPSGLALWAMPDAVLPASTAAGLAASVSFGNEPVSGIRESGLHSVERGLGGAAWRWTTGHAVFEVPGRTPAPGRLLVRLGRGPGTELEVRVDGRPVWKGGLPDAPSRSLALPLGLAAGSPIRIEMVCPTFVPDRRDPPAGEVRPLGVPLLELRLMP